MRLSTSMIYELGMRAVQGPQAEQLELQQRIASGRRVEKPSDDPVAAAAIVGIQQSVSVNEQYSTNAANAQATLSLEIDALNDVTETLRNVKTLLVRAGNPSLQNQDRASIASDAQEAIASQARSTQQSLSGVNLDEEAANLMRYQQAYQASGKVIQAAATVFDTILSIRG